MAVREMPEGIPLERWFSVFSRRRHCVWLDGDCEADGAEWSVLACDPVETRNGPAEDLLQWLDASSPPGRRSGLPFLGGLIGWFDYETDMPSYPPVGRPRLTGWLGYFDRALVAHLPSGRVFAVVEGEGSDADGRLAGWMEELATERFSDEAPDPVRTTRPEPDLGPDAYREGVRAVREWIASGDVYQANLAQRFSCRVVSGNAAGLYRTLRALNPAPFSAYLDGGERKILSCSPELFIEAGVGGAVRTRPIKGTRPRSSDPAEDAALRAALRGDPKEQAELLMIVDMERNDLGRVCIPGSMRSEREFSLETFASVHHLVGEVRGRLRSACTWSDLFAAAFPGGSITGAPKRRAMEIIRELERSERRAFCGAAGFASSAGGGSWNIGIRTMEWEGGRIEFGVGSGIVWDSDPEAEYRETLHKARPLLAALGWPVEELFG